MAEEQAAVKGGNTIVGWIKAGVTSLVGLASGAVLMYCSPLITSVIKPGKPVANFQCEVDGLKAIFHNRASGGSDGWWDFGDGSALEPFVSGQENVAHTFTRAGVYSVKLSVRSLFGEENERTVSVSLDGPTAAATAPVIDTFEVVPIQATSYAPATFRVVGKVKNAELCVWSPGNEQPLEVVAEVAGTQERYFTFKQPGTHVIKLAAYGNKTTVEKAQFVRVEAQPAGTVMAVLSMKYDAVHVTTMEKMRNFVVEFPPKSKDSSYRFDVVILSPLPGFEVSAARFLGPVQDPHLKAAPVLRVAADKKAHLTGELVKVPNTASKWVAQAVLTLERRSGTMPRQGPETAVALTAPGTTWLPMPPLGGGWVSRQRTLTLKLLDGDRTMWQGTQMPQGQEIIVRGRRFRVTATEAGDKLRIDLTEVPGGMNPVGN